MFQEAGTLQSSESVDGSVVGTNVSHRAIVFASPAPGMRRVLVGTTDASILVPGRRSRPLLSSSSSPRFRHFNLWQTGIACNTGHSYVSRGATYQVGKGLRSSHRLGSGSSTDRS